MNLEDMTPEEMEAALGGGPKAMKRSYAGSRGRRGSAPLNHDTMADDELAAELDRLEAGARGGVARETDPITPSDYALTDYAGQDRRGLVTDAVQHQEPPDVDLTPRNDDGTQDTSRVSDEVMRGTPGYGDAGNEAQGFAQFGLGMLVPGAISPALARMGAGTRLAAAGGQAAGGAAQEAAGGGSPRDILMATLAGGALGGLTAAPARAAHAPRTQAEIDAAALKAVPDKASYQRPDLPKGSRGTEQMATDAEMVLRSKLQGDKAALGLAMDDADAAFASLPPVPTRKAIGEIENIRRATHGGRGATLDSDPILAEQQRQMTRPVQAPPPEFSYPGAPREPPPPNSTDSVTPAQMRNIQRALTEEAGFARKRGASQAEAQLQQGAGVVSRAVREHDPSGNMGRALDEYGAGEDRLTRANELLYDRPQSNVPTEQSAIEGARGRISRAGQVTADDAATSHQNERRLGELGQVEPAGNDLISHIRARNTSARRGMFTLPNLLNPNLGNMAVRGVAHNASNFGFKLRRPEIDDAGMVAARPASRGADLALPLEIQLMLMQQERERRNAGQ